MRRVGIIAVVVVSMLLSLSVALASPGQPDRDMHPYVGMIVDDLGDGRVDPSCHITLISSTEAVTAHHCARTGSQIKFTFDNPVLVPAQIHTGVSRLGGFDFGDFEVDVAIVDLDTPILLPRYAELPTQAVVYDRGQTLDYVTYIGQKQSALVPCSLVALEICIPDGFPYGPTIHNEPAHVEFDRNLQRTTLSPSSPLQTDKSLVTNNPTCFGNSGSPIFLNGTDVVVGVLSSGVRGLFCSGGGNSLFARTDSELAMGILNGTVEPPPPPTAYPSHVEGSGTSGSLSFPATIEAGANYTGSVLGLTAAIETDGSVGQDVFTVFPASVAPGFRTFLAALRTEYTSGVIPNLDLDVYLVWYIGGQPAAFIASLSPTSDETALLTSDHLQFINQIGVDDLYNFEVWIHGWNTGGETATFTLFADELVLDEGNMTVNPITAAPDDPNVMIDLSWSGLNPAPLLHFGLIDHHLDGVPESPFKSTYVEIGNPTQP